MSNIPNPSPQIFFKGMSLDGPGRPLALRRFQPLILPRILDETSRQGLTSIDIENRTNAYHAFSDWHTQIHKNKFSSMTESQLEQAFNSQCLGALGYQSFDKVPAGSEFSLAPKHSLPNATPDVVLGKFQSPHEITENIRAIVELKGPQTNLDRLIQGRSPVQQAFDYLALLNGPDLWAIVSNMREFRLYSKSRSSTRALSYQLEELTNPDIFNQFYAAFNARNIIEKEPNHYSTIGMIQRSEQKQQTIGKELYKNYRDNRFALIKVIRKDPLCDCFEDALTAAQLLLDRIIFIAFAEDRGLLNNRRHIETAANTRVLGLTPWRAFQNLFRAIDVGDTDFNIPAFNGSHFKPHPIIDNPSFVLPSDPWMQVFRSIGDYDFEHEVNVTVLGNIFEQSITDIEVLRQSSSISFQNTDKINEISTTESPSLKKETGKSKTDSARKTHGVYYTDDSVTEYLVSVALDPVWDEALKRSDFHSSQLNPEEIVRAKLALLNTITLCDIACGSGAFLVAGLKWFIAKRRELLDELLDINPKANEFELTIRGEETQPWNEYDRTPGVILQNNIFGVDLSAESVEITRLSLWLYTARKGQKLTDLSMHIQRGNSVISDPDALPEGQKHLAFDWHARFPSIFSNQGGFTVVVGNPPYVRQETLGAKFKEFVKQNYEAYHGMADLYVYFYERGLNILRPGGQLAYIVTNKWMKAGYGEPLRKLFAERGWVRSVMDFGHAKQFFADADVFPCFLVVQKPVEGAEPPAETAVAVLNRDDVELKKLEEQISSLLIHVPRSRFGPDAWSLESPKVNELLEKIRRNGVPLSEYAGCKPLYGIKTGYNEAFLIDTATRDRLVQEDARSAEIIKPYLRGQDIKRWVPEWAGLWMIFTRRGIDIEQYPAIKRHLEQYREGLEPKPPGYTGKDWPGRKGGSYKWYEIQDSIDYWKEFEKPKIMYQVIQTHSQYCIDEDGLFGNDKTFMIPTDKKEVLACFNSPTFWYYAFATLPHMINEALNPACFVMESIPVADFSAKTRQMVIELTDRQTDHVKKLIKDQKAINDWLKMEMNVDKPTQKLLECKKLSSDEFVEEVKKTLGKTKPLTAACLRALRDEYRSSIEPMHQITAETNHLEREISNLVHHAYNLTPEDLTLMQKTAPPRMPVS